MIFKKYPYKGVKAATANAGIMAEKSIWAADGLLAIIIIPTKNPNHPPRTAPSPKRVILLSLSLAPSMWPTAIPNTNKKAKRSMAGPISPAALNAPAKTMTIKARPTYLIILLPFQFVTY